VIERVPINLVQGNRVAKSYKMVLNAIDVSKETASISNAVPGYNVAKRTKIILSAMGVPKETVSIPWGEFDGGAPTTPNT